MAYSIFKGPYKVNRVDGVFEVVYVDETQNYQKLNPHRTYKIRQAAHRRAATLNKQWQKERTTN